METIILIIILLIKSLLMLLTENIEKHPKAPRFIVNDRVRITKYKYIFSKEKYLLSILF